MSPELQSAIDRVSRIDIDGHSWLDVYGEMVESKFSVQGDANIAMVCQAFYYRDLRIIASAYLKERNQHED